MKKLLVILVIGMISCKKEIPNILTPQTKIVDTIIQSFIKIKTQVSPINSGTSFYNTLDKDYQNFKTKFQSFVGVNEHISWGRNFIDFDKDGDDDFIMTTTNYSQTKYYVYILENKNNIFSLWKKLDGFEWPMRSGLGDFDNNGYLDFWVSDQGYENPQQNYYPGAPMGIVYFYKDSVAIKYIPNSTDFNHSASSGDIDNDGDIDLLSINSKYINDGLGNFTKSNSISENVKAGYFHNQLYDIDNDGKLDALFGGSEIFGDSIYDASPRKYNGNNRIYWGNGLGNFSYSNTTALPLTYQQTKDTFTIVDDFNFMDFNNDGFQDIIVLRSCWKGVGYYIQFLQNNKNKTFTEVTDEYIDNYRYNNPTGKPNDFQWLVRLRFVDLNKDNKLDIIAREGAPNEMKWINNGNNRFKLEK